MKQISWIIFITLFLLKPEFLTAQNLLTNGEFDSDTSGWSASTNISWVSDDGGPISGQGSLMNTGLLNNSGSFPARSDKFVVHPQFAYLTGASFKVPADSPVPWAWYQIFWYDDMENLITLSDMVAADFGVPNDVWEHLAGLSQAPEEAATGELRIYFESDEPGNPDLPFGLWDDVFVFEDTVFLTSFD